MHACLSQLEPSPLRGGQTKNGLLRDHNGIPYYSFLQKVRFNTVEGDALTSIAPLAGARLLIYSPVVLHECPRRGLVELSYALLYSTAVSYMAFCFSFNCSDIRY